MIVNTPQLTEFSELVVYVVEDDEAMRTSISDLLSDHNIAFRMFASPAECLEQFDNKPGCFIFDLRLPEMDGLQLRQHLTKQGVRLPFIMISGNGDIPAAVDSMRMGAIDFLEKPFRTQQLVESIEKAFVCVTRDMDINRRLDSLTHREKEFLGYLVKGMSVKAISNEFEISPKTGHVHRRNIHQKMAVDCDAALVKLLEGFDV
jgi:FixJ family two-component response regulator